MIRAMTYRVASAFPRVVLCGALSMACVATETGFDQAPECEATETILGSDEQSALGFSADELWSRHSGAHATSIRWLAGGTTAATLTVAPGSGDIVYLEYYLPMGVMGPADLCQETAFEVPMEYSFESEDGAFDETWSARVQVGALDRVGFGIYRTMDQLEGSYSNPALSSVTIGGTLRVNDNGSSSIVGGIHGGEPSPSPGVPTRDTMLGDLGDDEI